MATCGLFGRVDTVWSPSGPPRSWEAPLPDIWTDVGAAAGDGKDQALIAEDLDRPRYGVAANVVLLLERCGMKLSRCRGAPGAGFAGRCRIHGRRQVRCLVWAGLVGGSSGEVAACAESVGRKVADRNVLHSTQSMREV